MGEALAASPEGSLKVLVHDRHSCLAKDCSRVQVRLALHLVGMQHAYGRVVRLSQGGRESDFISVAVEAGVAVFQDVIVAGGE